MTTRRSALAGLVGSTTWALSPATSAQTNLRTRRNINDLPGNHEIVQKYERAVAALRAKPADHPHNWDRLADIHRYRCPHRNWFFLPWHRAYLHHFERICARAIGDETFALPYWDWTARPTLPARFLEPSSPLHHPRETGSVVTLAAINAENIDRILRIRNFNSFASAEATQQLQRRVPGDLESGPHNTVHGDLGGWTHNMGDPAVAARDPIFWLHHNNIDRLWDSWTALGNANSANAVYRAYVFRAAAGSSPPEYVQGDFVDRDENRVHPRVSEALSSAAFGYRFDALRRPDAVVSSLVLPQVARSDRALLAGQRLSSDNLGFAVSATAHFSVEQQTAAVQVGGSVSLPNLRAIIRQEAGDVLGERVASNALIARAVARIVLTEPLPRGVTAQVLVNCDNPDAYTGRERQIFTGTIASFEHTAHAGHGGQGADDDDVGARTFSVDITDALASASSLGNGTLGGEITLEVVAPDTSLNFALQQAQIEFVE